MSLCILAPSAAAGRMPAAGSGHVLGHRRAGDDTTALLLTLAVQRLGSWTTFQTVVRSTLFSLEQYAIPKRDHAGRFDSHGPKRPAGP